MCNYGVEFQVNVVLIEIEDFQWNIMLNVLCQNNEVVSFVDGVESIVCGGIWVVDFCIVEGLLYMVIFG